MWEKGDKRRKKNFDVLIRCTKMTCVQKGRGRAKIGTKEGTLVVKEEVKGTFRCIILHPIRSYHFGSMH